MSHLLGATAAAASLGLCVCAFAHITTQPDFAAEGSYFATAFIVPHGCDGSPTVALRIKIPDGIIAVKPQMKPGWTVTVRTRKLARPLKGERGQTFTETADEVDWRGGPLPNDLYDTFGLMMKLPDGHGKTLYFPIIQECQQGVHRWIEIPAQGQSWNDLREPAPFIKLIPGSP